MDVIAIQIRATLGFDDAQLALGLLYYDGTGVPRDRAKAMRLFQRAADQGIAKAAWTLAQAELAAHTAHAEQAAQAAQKESLDESAVRFILCSPNEDFF